MFSAVMHLNTGPIRIPDWKPTGEFDERQQLEATNVFTDVVVQEEKHEALKCGDYVRKGSYCSIGAFSADTHGRE